jgi:2-oxoisovalerate dehydrogenase E2 component (dihydrolipoyl transacylase)
MQGGTFTVNNTGTFGSVSSMGIINHPQAAILQFVNHLKCDDLLKYINLPYFELLSYHQLLLAF